MRAHPRSRGENEFARSIGSIGAGSSPLTRGKPANTAPRKTRGRLIPAHAGKTISEHANSDPAQAHPRSRGENLCHFVHGDTETGSSPLTRGKRLDRPIEIIPHGLIPAHAGKTEPRSSIRPTRAAHPRSRGENYSMAMVLYPRAGSSPLTRGKRPDADGGGSAQRLIPAHAGKTRRPARRADGRKAHPRSRGENGVAICGVVTLQGSSPLTRGKPAPVGSMSFTRGLIPAHAGKTAA